MAWCTKGTGKNYNSYTGYGRALGALLKKIINSWIMNRLCRTCEIAERKGVKPKKHVCIKNWNGSAKAMEAAAILKMVIEGPDLGYVVDAIVSDDDSTMRAHLCLPCPKEPFDGETPAQTRKRIKDDKGKLPHWIREPNFLADPTHRNKVVASKFYDLATARVSMSRLTKTHAARLKKDWGYVVAQNKTKPIEEFMLAAKAPVEHLFNNHLFCGDWCDALKAAKEGKSYVHPQGWLSRDNPEGEKIYHQLTEITKKYGSRSYLLQSNHEYTTQTNEALNRSQTKTTPKDKVFHTTPSFGYRHAIVVGTHNWGHTEYWKRTFSRLGLAYSDMLLNHLERCDIKKEQKRDIQKRPTVKRKRACKQASTERALLYEERTSGKEHGSGIGLDVGHGTKPKKRKTNEKQKSNEPPKPCKWCGASTHKTWRSKSCPKNGEHVAAVAAKKKSDEEKSRKNNESEVCTSTQNK